MDKEFGCDNTKCNQKIVAIPPDDSYVNLYLNKCCEKSIKQEYKCDNCDHINIRYWCITHGGISIGVSYESNLVDESNKSF